MSDKRKKVNPEDEVTKKSFQSTTLEDKMEAIQEMEGGEV